MDGHFSLVKEFSRIIKGELIMLFTIYMQISTFTEMLSAPQMGSLFLWLDIAMNNVKSVKAK